MVRQKKLPRFFASFQHSTSRENQPQLHTHLVLLNTGIKENGKGYALDGRPLLENIKTLGAIYENEIRRGLHQELGVRTKDVTYEREVEDKAGKLKTIKSKSFEIEGVPKELCEFHSKRREQIKEVRLTTDTKLQDKFKVLSTRKAKEGLVDREALFLEARKTAKSFGFEPKKLLYKEKPKELKTNELEEIKTGVSRSLSGTSKYKGAIKESDVFTQTLKESKGRLSTKEAEKFSKDFTKEYLHSFGNSNVHTLNKKGVELSQKDSLYSKVREKLISPLKRILPEGKPLSYQYRKAQYEKQVQKTLKKQKAFKRKAFLLYMTGKISRKKYVQIRDDKGQPKTKLGVNAKWLLTNKISTKQRDYLLKKIEQERQKVEKAKETPSPQRQEETRNHYKEKERER